MKQWLLDHSDLPLRISRRAGSKHIRLRLLPDGTLSVTLPWQDRKSTRLNSSHPK
mgnify:CR=1 FL=1